jgi:diguanylate cyclase (GGDEF)-like protein
MGTAEARGHPRTLGWLSTVSLAMGGSNQSLFLIGALLAAQGTAAVPLLIVGLLLSWAALPGWTELILMWPDRIGGIAATCSEAFRPYSPVLANLTGVCYWWGWVPTCGLTAILSADALHSWYLPHVPIHLLAAAIVLVFAAVNLSGVRRTSRLAIPIAVGSASLAVLSALVPILAGHVNWTRAFSFHLQTPFHGAFGALTSAMAGLYLVGFAAPAFEAAACHVGETRDPARNVPRAMFGAAGMATLYFVVLPIVWLGVFGPHPLQQHLAGVLGPTFAPLFGGLARGVAVWFMVLNMFHGTLQPLAGASRTLSQLAEDGLLPASWTLRNRFDVPWLTTGLTAVMSIIFLQSDDPTWVIAAANLAYLIGIAMPSVAVWLLRRNDPGRARPYRAPRGTIGLGLVAAGTWLTATLLGFEQFGLPTVIASLGLCYAGVGLYAWRRWRDDRALGRPWPRWSLHAKLTAAMIAVVALDGGGYLVAISHVGHGSRVLVAILQDIFVGVALLTINVGLVIPGVVSHAVGGIAAAARRLAGGTLLELTYAMEAIGRGELQEPVNEAMLEPLPVRGSDELAEMSASFNRMQSEIGRAARALEVTRGKLQSASEALADTAERQATVARLGVQALNGDTLESILVEIVEAARDVMGADSAVIYEYGEGVAEITVRAGAGLPPSFHRHVLEPEAARILRLESDEHLEVDWSAARMVPPGLVEQLGATVTVAVPIVEHDHHFGSLSVNYAGPRGLAPDELDTLRALANLLASAVERERSADQMRHRALHDPLTGLPNRTLFVDRLDRAIAQSRRRHRPVGVLFLDIDYFKFVNDSLGHSVGDELQRSVGARLEESVRLGDTVARFGGDEFLVICEDLASPAELTQVAERIVDALRRPFTLAGVQHVISASIGVAVGLDGRRGSEDLIREADAAMYRAKESGRDRYDVYDEVMRATATRRLSIEQELRGAVERDELCLAFQPVVDLASRRIIATEALVRWQHPTRGLLLPGDFIAVAEQTGAIRALGEWVLRAAAHQAAAWSRLSGERALPVAVNLSARQVTHHTLLPLIQSVLGESGLPPELLHIEITESVLMDPSEANIERLRALRDLGVRIVLDDFGTGYSSLAYVKRFPIHTLKIDQAFVRDLDGPTAESSIVEAIIAMADGLRVEVIAEGVETQAQAARLLVLGCRQAQGYLYSKPVWAAELEGMLDSQLGPTPVAGFYDSSRELEPDPDQVLRHNAA